MKANSNIALLNEARNTMRRAWNNDGGAFDNDGRFDNDSDNDGGDNDGGFDNDDDGGFDSAAGCAVQPRKENSRPYIIISQNASGAAQTVTLLNASVNLTSANFGNVAGVNLTFGYPNQTYGGFLNTTINQPFNLGKLRVEASSTVNIPTAFTFTETQYIGDANTTSLVPEIYLNQFYQLAIEINCDILVNSTKNLQFVQLDATTLTVKLFPSEVIASYRGLEKKKLVKIMDDPNTTTLPTHTVVINNSGKHGKHGHKHGRKHNYPIR